MSFWDVEVERKTGTMPTPDVSPEDYPVDEWSKMRSRYSEYWYHFSGLFLEEEEDGQPKYPVALNPFRLACLLHAGFLPGEARDVHTFPVTTTAFYNGSEDQKLTDIISLVWENSGGKDLFMDAAIISQVLGGFVLGVFPDRSLDPPVRIDLLAPDYFYPVYNPANYRSDILEAFVVYQITGAQARLVYNVDASGPIAIYQERYTAYSYEVTVDGEVALSPEGERLEGITPGGKIPYVYVPHIRAGEFYGISLLAGMLKLASEINERWADNGDAVSNTANQLPIVSGIRNLALRTVDPGLIFLDAGIPVSGTHQPQVFWPPASFGGITESSIAWTDKLLEIALLMAFVPPAALGIDAASQRSAEMMAMKMLPLVTHLRQERAHWSAALSNVSRRILLIASEYGIIGRNQATRSRFKHDWAPILPRDQSREIADLVALAQANLMSPERALREMGVADVEGELEAIKDWAEFLSGLNRSFPSPDPTGPFKGTGARSGVNATRLQDLKGSKDKK